MSTENPLSMPLGEAIYSLRAIRRLKSDPIPDADLKEILEATIRAPNGGNQQPWHFIVVKKPELRRQLGDLYHEARASMGRKISLRRTVPRNRPCNWPMRSATRR
jgi:nitroreductase